MVKRGNNSPCPSLNGHTTEQYSPFPSLQAAGINVIHLMPIPETTQDLTTFINSTYPTANKIDVSGSG
jgi:hypothetical protein